MFKKKDVSKKFVSSSTFWLVGILGMSLFCYFNKDFNFSKLTQIFDLANAASTIVLCSIPIAFPCYLVYSVYTRIKQSNIEYEDSIKEQQNKKNNEGE
ncbi:hypothetical protein [Enterobacter cloacae complex sp. 418I7]|uniref:hypothetical protein n=1 Tax=Enterobacter cloacae complex sp. 418I7 TaxID=3395839 RepID=UPI003CF0F53D